ncbi:hypothetical protein [Williamsia sp.]|uniref:hypothetical protein n=1 Tax=Williamsia sp. TaxID=1872085 RepID=UPI0025DA7FE3|nr:hypothetical protein [Williamsia sp.]
MSGAATLHSAQCPKNSAALAGTPGASNTDDITVAVRAEAGLVKEIYTSESGRVPDVSLSAPTALTVGGAPAVQIVATVTGIESSACVGPTAVHSMIATTVPGQQGTVLFVISLRQGVPGAVDAPTAARMASTLRRNG